MALQQFYGNIFHGLKSVEQYVDVFLPQPESASYLYGAAMVVDTRSVRARNGGGYMGVMRGRSLQALLYPSTTILNL